MSEKSPFAKQLENFDAEAWETELAPDVDAADGRKLSVNEKRKQLEEADAYHQYMEKFANFSDEEIQERRDAAEHAANFDRVNDEEVYERNGHYFEELDGPIEGTPEHEEAMMREAEAERLRELDEKIEADPDLSAMNTLAEKINELREKGGNENLIRNFEDRLNRQLAKYEEENPDFDADVADLIMDRTDKAPSPETAPGAEADDDEDGPEAAPGAKTGEDDDDSPETAPGVKTGEDDDDDSPETAPGAKTGEDDDDDPETAPGAETDGDDGDDSPETAPGAETDDGDEEDDPETRPPEPRGWLDRLRDRLRGGEGEGRDRRRFYVTLGAAAVAAVVVGAWVAWSQKDPSVLQNALGGAKPPVDTSTMFDTPGIDMINGNPPVPVDTLPPSPTEGFPWNWASEAFPGENAMEKLRELGERAAADGHNVEWHGSGAREWVEVDGNSTTKDVVDILRQYQ